MRRKGAVKAAAWLMSACMLIGSLPAIPGMSRKVSAAETKIEGFATKEQLLTDYSMDGAARKKIGKVTFGQNEEGTAQSWYIAGKDPATEDGLVLFAASPMKKKQAFHNPETDHPYDAAWGCEYGSAPSQVSANHYGGSDIRKVLKNMSSDPAYFTADEQKVMRETAVKTEDQKNGSVYTTKDKMYLAHGEGGSKLISVGTNEEKDVNAELKIDLDQYQNGSSWFWLRSPNSSYDYSALMAQPAGTVTTYDNGVTGRYCLVPALQINLTSVIFASAAPAATSEGSQETKGKDMTLRYDAGEDLGSVEILNHKTAEVKKTAEDRYLVVQNDQGVWRKKAENETTVSAKEVTIDGKALNSFKGCKVWLEKTDATRITKATRPDQTGEKLSEYTVTFKDYDGKVLETQKVKYEEGAKAPTAPTRAGYTFTGWDKDFSKVTGELEVTAQYKKNEYKVTFKDYDGKVLETQTVKYEEAAKTPKTPTRAGYTFTGWDKTFSKITANIIITAQYKKNPEPAKRPTEVHPGINLTKKEILSGKKFRLSVRNRIKGAKVSYKTSNKKIATVDKNGNVKGLKAGRATITITIRQGGKTYYLKSSITVKGYVKLIKVKKTIKKGKSYKFKAKAYGIKGKLKWSVSKKKIGKISKSGKFKAKKKGKTYVTVKCGKYKAKVCVRVK